MAAASITQIPAISFRRDLQSVNSSESGGYFHRIARIDSLMGMLDAVSCGTGIGLLLCLLADGEDDLVPMPEPLDELDTELWILTHPDIKQVARIKALADFLYENLSASDKVTRIEARRSQ